VFLKVVAPVQEYDVRNMPVHLGPDNAPAGVMQCTDS